MGYFCEPCLDAQLFQKHVVDDPAGQIMMNGRNAFDGSEKYVKYMTCKNIIGACIALSVFSFITSLPWSFMVGGSFGIVLMGICNCLNFVADILSVFYNLMMLAFAFLTRGAIRKKHRIPRGNCCTCCCESSSQEEMANQVDDFFCVLCCAPCASCQHARTVYDYGASSDPDGCCRFTETGEASGAVLVKVPLPRPNQASQQSAAVVVGQPAVAVAVAVGKGGSGLV